MSVDGRNSNSKGPPPRCKKKAGAISVNINYTRYDVVKKVAEDLEYAICSEDSESFITWSDSTITSDRCAELKPFQRINHFPGMGEIARKDSLARNLGKMQRCFSEDYDFFPRTWSLPADYSSLMNHYHDLKKRGKRKTFICKPANGAMGNGIHLLQNLEKFTMHDTLVVQDYLDRPLVVDGLKFDLRIYVLVLSCDPLKVFLYDDGLMRFSTSKYAPPTDKNLDNVYMHLTNYSINKSNKDYDGCDDETKGSKRSIRYLKTWMEANNYSFTTLWSSIEDIVIKTLLVAEPYLMHAYRMARPGTTSAASSSVCFEVLGMDIFVDRKLRPWLLEVNRSPSFGTDSKVDNDIKFDVIRTSFQLLNLKPSEKRKALAAQKQLSQARLLKPRARNERKSQFNVRKTFLRSQLSEVRRVSDQASYEEKHCGNFKKIFPTTGARQTEYVSLLNSAFRTFMAGRGIVLEQKAHSGMMQHLRESELLDMLQQCEQEETAAIQAKMAPAPPPPPVSKTNHKVQPLSKLRPWSSPPPSPFMFSRYSSPSFNSEDNAAFISRNERIRRIRMSEDRSLAIQKSNSILLKQINTLFKQNQELDDQTFRRDLKNATRKGPSKSVPFRSTNKFMFNSIIKYKSKPLLSCSINNLSDSSFKLSNHQMRPVGGRSCNNCTGRFCPCADSHFHVKSSR